MRLRRVLLENVRPFARLDLRFEEENGPRRRTLLVGRSGCGKSAALAAIALLAAPPAERAKLPTAGWVRAGAAQATLQADLSIGGADVVAAFDLRPDAALDGSPTALDAARISNPNDGLVFLARPGSHPSDALDRWAAAMVARRGANGLLLVREALADLLPDAPFTRLDADRLLLETPDGPLPLAALGDADRDTAAWLGALLLAAGVERPQDVRGLLLLDAIDARLHPARQRLLLPVLDRAFPQAQLVIATNSPFTAHSAEEGEVFVLRRPAPGAPVEASRFPGAPRTMLLHQVVLSQLFDLPTLDSPPVERLREEYRAMQTSGPALLDAESGARLRDLRRELADLPDWNTPSPREREQIELLAEIRRALQGGGQASDERQ
jgi:energy-coupling factor transporter ATP-binding protein EcfA2